MSKTELHTEDGTPKTPEQLADEIVNAPDVMLEISDLAFEALTEITRYMKRDVISNRNEKWFTSNADSLRKEVLEKMLLDKNEQIKKYLAERDNAARYDLFRKLIAKGTDVGTAIASAFPNGIPAPKK